MLWEELLLHTLRGPMMLIAMLPLVASTGTWQYLASSWSAYDVTRAAALTPDTTRLPNVAVVAIDDAGYQGYFGARSPIDRDRAAALLAVVDRHAPDAKRIVLDLDLSPVPGQAAGQHTLDQLFLANPQRWVLAAVDAGTPEDIANLRQWRQSLCAQGLSFGLPYIPNEFGYPKLTHQYVGGLADAALAAPGTCADPAVPFVQKLMPMSPHVLASGLTIPFNGDLEALGQVLDMVRPEWIVVGGAWGQTDIFGSPFGDRFGVNVHLAALAGGLTDEREASHFVAVCVALLFVTLCSVVLRYTSILFAEVLAAPTPHMVGHRYFLTSIQPIVFVFVVLALIAAMAQLAAVLRAHAGYWVPTSYSATMVLAYLLLKWNWGQVAVDAHLSLRHVWHEVVSHPIQMELKSLAASYAVLRLGNDRIAWGVNAGELGIGRVRAAAEGALALLGLLMQTLFPVGSLLYAATVSTTGGGH